MLLAFFLPWVSLSCQPRGGRLVEMGQFSAYEFANGPELSFVGKVKGNPEWWLIPLAAIGIVVVSVFLLRYAPGVLGLALFGLTGAALMPLLLAIGRGRDSYANSAGVSTSSLGFEIRTDPQIGFMLFGLSVVASAIAGVLAYQGGNQPMPDLFGRLTAGLGAPSSQPVGTPMQGVSAGAPPGRGPIAMRPAHTPPPHPPGSPLPVAPRYASPTIVPPPQVAPVRYALLAADGHHVLLNKPTTSIGREVDCDVRLADPQVSRHHATLHLTPQGLVVRDEGSANGTYVNEQRVQTPTPLNFGDSLRLATGNTFRIGTA